MYSYVCITGGTGGLGKAFAAECAERGWDLLLTDVTESKLPPIAKGLSRLYGVEVLTHACDLTNPEQRAEFWHYIQDNGIQFHMLINVAGVDFEGRFRERSLDELRTIVRLNIEATLEMTRSVMEYRDPCRPLRIINVSSLASFYPMPLKAVYAASKRFLLDITRALNQEIEGDEATITALCPAGLPTTPGAIHKIQGQGWMGQVTTMNVGLVAAKTVKASLKGKPVYVPGILNQILRFLGGLVPASSLASLLKRRWSRASQQSELPSLEIIPALAEQTLGEIK